jgi:hypothetical protein
VVAIKVRVDIMVDTDELHNKPDDDKNATHDRTNQEKDLYAVELLEQFRHDQPFLLM